VTKALSCEDIAKKIGERFPNAVTDFNETAVFVRGQDVLDVARFLKETLGLEFDYLNSITAVDYPEHFEVVYHLTSIKNNHSIVLKARCYDRDNPRLPSVVSLWPGADFQEREVYDFMGIAFDGHPNLKRIFLWHGFPGHPLRKDYKSDV